MAETDPKKSIPPGLVVTGRVDSVNVYHGKADYWSVDINAPGSGTITIKLPENVPHDFDIDERYSVPVKYRMANYNNGKPPVPEFVATAAGVRR